MTINSVRLLKTINVSNAENPTTNYELVIEFANVTQRDAFVQAEKSIEVNAHLPLRAKSARNEKCALISVPKSDSSTNVHKDTLDALVAYLVAKFPDSDKFQGEIAVIEEQWSVLSRDRTRSIIDAEVPTQTPVVPSPSTPNAAPTNAAPTTPEPQSAPTSSPLTAWLNTLSQFNMAALRTWAQNVRLPTIEEITQKGQSFINAPTRHPVTLALVASFAAAFSGFSFMGMLIIGASTYAGTRIRERLYSHLEVPSNNTAQPAEITAAFNAGREAGANWTAYFESFKVKNNWVHALAYGKGLKQKMDENERNAQGNRLS